MNKISLQMFTLREFTSTIDDLEKTVEKLRKIGFEMIQYSVPRTMNVKEVKRIFENNRIKNDSVFCRALDLEEHTSEMLEQCEIFETNRIRIDSIPRGLTSSASGYKMFAHYLNEAGAELKRHGKRLYIIFMPSSL